MFCLLFHANHKGVLCQHASTLMKPNRKQRTIYGLVIILICWLFCACFQYVHFNWNEWTNETSSPIDWLYFQKSSSIMYVIRFANYITDNHILSHCVRFTHFQCVECVTRTAVIYTLASELLCEYKSLMKPQRFCFVHLNAQSSLSICYIFIVKIWISTFSNKFFALWTN